jgi:hypothetical protein
VATDAAAVKEIVEAEWAYLVGLLPVNLDDLAVATGALRRRRAVASGEGLLRLCLAYALEDWSLRQTAAMAEMMGWQSVSDVAILKRLRACPKFLAEVISAVLLRRLEAVPRPELRVCLVDATTVSRPGSTGTDWRLHVCFDLRALQLYQVELTDPSRGESLSRFVASRGEIYVGDRAYGTTPGVVSLLEVGADFIVRTSLQQIRLAGPDGGSASLIPWLAGLADASPGECPVRVESAERSWPLRLVAVRKSPQAIEAAKEKARRDSARKGHAIREETLVLAEYVVVLCNCGPEVTPVQILETYRFRWQIELAFKRLKSLLFLDNLRARDPQLAQTYLLAKLLGALLAEELIDRAGSFSPWGYLLATPAG